MTAEPGAYPGGALRPPVLAAFVLAGLAWRLAIAWWTPLCSEDGANYLWMADAFAAGQPCAALSEVFPPLHPLLMALPRMAWPAWDSFRAGQVVVAVVGALAVWPLARLAERCVKGSGLAAAWLVAFAPLPVRFGAECYSEPLFLALAAAALERFVARRHGWAGLWLALAYAVRPEAAVLGAALALTRPRALPWLALPGAGLALALAAARAGCGLGFEPLPKAGLIWERSVGVADGLGDALLRTAEHALALPWLWVEAFGVLGLLALWGLARGRLAPRAPLVWALGLGLLVVCAFLPRRRFLISWLPAVLPFAAAGAQGLPARARVAALALAVVSSLVLSCRVMDADRVGERLVGEHLAAVRAPGERTAGDMTRVLYYAGERPLTPRPFEAAELVAAARAPEVRFVVLGARRTTTQAVVDALAPAFAPWPLPPELAAAAEARGILVLSRR